MNIRSYFYAFGVTAIFNLVLAALGVILYQAGVYTGYNGTPGVDWDAVWATFGGLGSFLWLVGGLLAITVLGTVAGVLAHRRLTVGAVIFAILILVIGILMGRFVDWDAVGAAFGGFWPFLGQLVVFVVFTAVETFLVLLAYERRRH